MSKRVAILQSNYIPWKGYFDLINSVDEFVLYDTAQFTKNNWRNRNKIKTRRGVTWLTIPVRHHFGQSVEETVVANQIWPRGHWESLCQSYAGAACFGQYKSIFEKLYQSMCQETNLSMINHHFLTEICDILGIRTRITWSKDYRLAEARTERLVDLCVQLGASEYVSGPAAREYIDADLFVRAGVVLTYFDYSGYPEYPQLFGRFEHGVSILDLIFNEGPNAPKRMKSFPVRGIGEPSAAR